MRTIRLENAVPITPDIYWVGLYDPHTDFHCNPYLLVDRSGDAVLIDPGSIPDFPVILRKVIDIIDPSAIAYLIAHHQDPDVCGSMAVIEDLIDRPDLQILSHSLTSRLIRHYGISSEIVSVDELGGRVFLASGRELEFIPTPYLHAPGAMVTYDRTSKSLFSSDIFGTVSKKWSLFMGEGDFESMGVFHRAYMPSGGHLRRCMQGLKDYEIDRILPQHGSILEGDRVGEAIDYLMNLEGM